MLSPSSKPAAPVVGLVDCNNFYVSCQRVFDAGIQNSAVGVMSNNDGCIIARSDELKKLVPMGTPVFKAQKVIEANDVVLFSSCYPLYADMSTRVMSTLEEFTPALETYSIDEAFLEFDRLESDSSLTETGWRIKERIKRVTGIPVSVGFAATKTLAKLANGLAKKSPKAKGVLDLYQSPYLPAALQRTAVGDVWGLGKESAAKLARLDVYNALEFSELPLKLVRGLLTVKGARTALELRGVPCIPLERVPVTKKAISCSRTFGETVFSLSHLKQAVAFFLARATEKLRRNNLCAKTVTVFISTDAFNRQNYYANSATATFVYPSDLLNELQARALSCLRGIYRPGFEYKRAGVILSGLIPAEAVTGARLLEPENRERREKLAVLMQVMGEINEKYGRDTLRLAVSNPDGIWQMKQLRKSNHFTTRLDEILIIE
jgi:DNA polymerase V